MAISPKEIVTNKLNHPITNKEQIEIKNSMIQKQPAQTQKAIIISGFDFGGHLIHKAIEIESANLTVITDNLETSFITSRFFDDHELHKGIFTRQLGCMLKFMYSQMPHSEVKEIWDAVSKIIDDEEMTSSVMKKEP